MFFPFGIDYDYDRRPWATWGLMAFCVVCFLVAPHNLGSAVDALMLWPDRFAPWQWWTSGFLHGDILHLGGNMLFLWVYGRYVEQRLGPWRFLALYAMLAPFESLAFVMLNWGGNVPAIGASGVISGLMGIVMAVAPSARVKTFLWFGPIFRTVHIHAGLILGLWVIEQSALAALGSDGIAVSSHLGGFAAGFGIGWMLRSERLRGTSWHLSPTAQSREDVEMRAKADYYGDLAEYYRDKDISHVGAHSIPDWLRPDSDADGGVPGESRDARR